MSRGRAASVTEVWDRLMRLQTDLSQPIELSFFFGCQPWLDAARVLDIGTGNGYYLRRLATYFPEKSYVGIDLDPEHIAMAEREGRRAAAGDGGAGIRFLVGDAHQLEGEYDLVLARLLIQHLSSVEEFLASASRAIRPGGSLIVIESSDETRRWSPAIPAMTAFFETFRARRRSEGCDRDAGRLLAEKVTRFGFEAEASAILVVPSTIPGYKDMFLETYLTVLQVVRSAFEVECDYDRIVADLNAWWAEPASYSQLGVHLASYRRAV
jgi:ubiquinone/menaquinone biosynthesis C-methylase UbiE